MLLPILPYTLTLVVALFAILGELTDSFSLITTSPITPPSMFHRRTIQRASRFSLLRAQRRFLVPSSAAIRSSSRQDVLFRERVRLFSAVSNPKPSVSTTGQDKNESDKLHNIEQVTPFFADHETSKNAAVKSEPEINGHDPNKDILDGIKSRPIPNGNWDVQNPLGWTKDFGRRSAEYEESLKSKVQLKPGDEGYFEHDPNMRIPGVTMVRSKEQAQIVLEKLKQADPSIFHACDTEVMDIDLKSVGPVGNGYVTCISIYSGPDFDYGLGEGPGSVLWIDNLDDAYGVLQEFKEWFEDKRYLKVWHNYGFDRHGKDNLLFLLFSYFVCG